MSIDPQLLLFSTWQTLYMVFCASVVSIFFGLTVGILLIATCQKGPFEQRAVYRTLSLLVNIGRSIPFIVLMVALIPFTRLLAGTSIGMHASIIPLSIAAIPFYARIAESAFKQVDPGVIEAAQAMGASPWQLIYKVILPESIRPLLEGATLTIIALISYSGIVGVIGGGGLGDVAIRYGYQRFDVSMMVLTIAILVLLVQGVQWIGDFSSKHRTLKLWIGLSCLLAISIGFQTILNLRHSSTPSNTIRVGISAGPEEQVMQVAEQVAEQQYGLHIKTIVFEDYVLPNEALATGQIDANIFQHVPYLDTQIKEHGYQIEPIGKTFVYPMGFYSIKIKTIQALRNGAIIAIPNDPSNEGRALLLLQQAGLIHLNSQAGLLATPQDITSNPKHLHFKELDAADVPRALPDVSMGAITNDYVADAHFTVNQALIKEGPNAPYANVIVVQDSQIHNPNLKKLVLIMHSPPVVAKTEALFPDGAAIPAWDQNDK